MALGYQISLESMLHIFLLNTETKYHHLLEQKNETGNQIGLGFPFMHFKDISIENNVAKSLFLCGRHIAPSGLTLVCKQAY